MQLLAASWYDLAKKTADSKKAFKHKMICSGIYMAGLLLCMAIGKHFSDIFGWLFFCGYIMLFLHDVLEEHRAKPTIIISDASGALGYLLTACALGVMNHSIFSSSVNKTHIDEIIALICAIVCVVICLATREHIAKLIPTAFLLARAIIFGISLQNSGDAKMQAASCAMIMGTLAITTSVLLSVFDKKGAKSLIRINLYYFGLMFISCSVAVL